MRFNDIIKEVLLSQLSLYGFTLDSEYKGNVVLRKADFTVSTSYDYSFSKDFSFRICYQLNPTNKLCIEDFELASIFGFDANKYEILSENEQIYKFAHYYEEVLKAAGPIVFDEQNFLKVWNETNLKIAL